jgi:hypothetical protein
MLPMYNTKTFSQIFPDFDSMKSVFDNDFDKYAKDCISANSLKTLYWQLFARYSDNPIANLSESIFKAKIVAITYAKGPAWERKLSLQKSLRDLTDSELLAGAKTIFNTARNPETEPGTDTDTELTYINDQSVSKRSRGKLDAYSYLQDVLRNDVTEEFIREFAKLFAKFVSPNVTRIYVTDLEEE